MVKNPQAWFEKCSNYAVPNENTILFGDLFLLQDNAPNEIMEIYKAYIALLKKVYVNTSVFDIENKEIIGMRDDLTPKGREQAELVIKLIEQGLLPSKVV